MNTPNDNHDNLRYAEYVLGVLDADERAGVERDIREDSRAAAAVDWWQEKLAPLVDEIPATAPPEYVWARIREALGHSPEATAVSPRRIEPAASRGWWNNLSLWRGWGLAASAVAIVCLVLLFAFPQQPRQPVAKKTAGQVQVAYMVSNIQQTNGQPAWTATMDVTHARMVVAPSGKVSVPGQHSAELWLIPPGHKPIAVGLVSTRQAAVMSLPRDLVAKLGPKAVLAVSVEPQGGSPTGQPTGPVIAKGAISAASG